MNYEIKELPTEEFNDYWKPVAPQFFDDTSQIFRLREGLNEKEMADWGELEKNMGNPQRINLAAFHKGEFVGWSWGYQESAIKFYMCNSAVLPEHRRKGLYTKLMNETIRRAEEEGYQEITSRHVVTNNAVIIPKLKAGFIIKAMEMTDLFGVCIVLSYYPNKIRKKILDYRAGQTKPDDEIKKLLRI